MGEDVAAIIDGVSSVYPQSYSSLHDNDGNLSSAGLDSSPPCGDRLQQGFYFWLLAVCFNFYCTEVQSEEESIACVDSNCYLPYIILSQECIQCLITTGPNLDEVIQK